jgi:hypothetical protein
MDHRHERERQQGLRRHGVAELRVRRLVSATSNAIPMPNAISAKSVWAGGSLPLRVEAADRFGVAPACVLQRVDGMGSAPGEHDREHSEDDAPITVTKLSRAAVMTTTIM